MDSVSRGWTRRWTSAFNSRQVVFRDRRRPAAQRAPVDGPSPSNLAARFCNHGPFERSPGRQHRCTSSIGMNDHDPSCQRVADKRLPVAIPPVNPTFSIRLKRRSQTRRPLFVISMARVSGHTARHRRVPRRVSTSSIGPRHHQHTTPHDRRTQVFTRVPERFFFRATRSRSSDSWSPHR